MSQCPKCAASLKEDYGMVTCPSCGAILFVDMEGIAHMGADPEPKPDQVPAPMEEFAAPPSMTPVHEESFPENHVFDQSPALDPIEAVPSPMQDWLAPIEMPSSDSMNPTDDQVSEASSEHESPPAIEPASQPEGEFSMDAFLGYQDPSASGEPSAPLAVEPLPQDFGPADDPLNLNGYANSEISQAKDGLLVFRVILDGIDTKEIRESLREAINDSRFGWDIADIMSRIEKGHLAIDNVSPVKASILINRIKKLPIRIRWEQYAITQVESP